MNCTDVGPHLWSYFDGECPATIHDAVKRHLLSCTTCSHTLDGWSHLSQSAFSRRDVKAPPFLWTRVLASIEALELTQAGLWWTQWGWMSRITAVVAVVVSLAAGMVFYNSSSGTLLESLFVGQAGPSHTLQLSSRPNQTEVTAWVLGGDNESSDDTEAKI